MAIDEVADRPLSSSSKLGVELVTRDDSRHSEKVPDWIVQAIRQPERDRRFPVLPPVAGRPRDVCALGHRRLLTADHGRPEVAEASPALSYRCRARPPPLVLPVSLRDDCDTLVSVAEKLPGRYLHLGMTDVAWPGGPPTSTASPRPPPPRPTWRDHLRTIGFVALAVLWVALRIVLRIALEPEDPPVAETPVTSVGTFVRTLPAGTCFIEAYPADFVRPTPCTERHGSELVALLPYPAPPGGAFPPVQEAFRVALALCETAFNAFVGGTADRTRARFFVALPRVGDWRGGERLVVCFANGRNGVELTNSVRGSAAAAGR